MVLATGNEYRTYAGTFHICFRYVFGVLCLLSIFFLCELLWSPNMVSWDRETLSYRSSLAPIPQFIISLCISTVQDRRDGFRDSPDLVRIWLG